jgi:serine/threonine-protein kinase HipA
MAARALLPEKIVLDTARETVALFHQRWQAEKKNLALSRAVIDAIEAHVKKIPLGNAA